MPPNIIVVGGGAAGFFAAIASAEINPKAEVSLLERSAHLLAKVKISGGGRCNVTNACFEPALLVSHYPRGGSALRGPFTRFQPQHTMEWFQARGVPLKTEPDNRVFPISNQSESIIQCLKTQGEKCGVTVCTNARIESIQRRGDAGFALDLGTEKRECDRLILATGSNPYGWEWAQVLGHTLIPPVPSLFTFSIKDPRLEGLAGVSVPSAQVSLQGTSLKQTGPLLITHWGMSGPAILKLSAWGARELHARTYRATLEVNWIGQRLDKMVERFKARRDAQKLHIVVSDNIKEMPKRLWQRLAMTVGIKETTRWGEVSNDRVRDLALQITQGTYEIQGRGVFKEEFVTAGGVMLDDVDFRTLQSKRCPGLFFAGEILDIDGETGGFNFQNAWTTGWIAGQSAAS